MPLICVSSWELILLLIYDPPPCFLYTHVEPVGTMCREKTFLEDRSIVLPYCVREEPMAFQLVHVPPLSPLCAPGLRLLLHFTCLFTGGNLGWSDLSLPALGTLPDFDLVSFPLASSGLSKVKRQLTSSSFGPLLPQNAYWGLDRIIVLLYRYVNLTS